MESTIAFHTIAMTPALQALSLPAMCQLIASPDDKRDMGSVRKRAGGVIQSKEVQWRVEVRAPPG
jgi:hypothetical protein